VDALVHLFLRWLQRVKGCIKAVNYILTKGEYYLLNNDGVLNKVSRCTQLVYTKMSWL